MYNLVYRPGRSLPPDPIADALISDDFSSDSLNTALWSIVNPRNDATFTLSGTGTPDARLSITVPAGVSHDIWTGGNFAPRIMQAANNTDFEIEVKFESALTAQYQTQGVIIQQDANNYLRFDFVKDVTRTRAFAASFTNGAPTVRSDTTIPPGNPLFLRVKRVGNQWTQSYSSDGTTWTAAASFSHTLNVTSVGPFAGNHGNPASVTPGFTGLIDYFFNTASPIVPEDVGDSTGPIIDVWYGNDQVFGQIGIPQIWVNILGKISDTSGIASLTYSLNSGPQTPLSIGPDGKRLQSPGDFNINIPYDDLSCGQNTVTITAADVRGNSSSETVNVEYVCNNFWPLPYSIDWTGRMLVSSDRASRGMRKISVGTPLLSEMTRSRPARKADSPRRTLRERSGYRRGRRSALTRAGTAVAFQFDR